MVAFSKEECAHLIEEIQTFPEPRWFHRNRINSRPTQGVVAANYDFCGDRQQPKAFNAYLRSLAPVIDGAWLAEACINRYRIGGGMPEHVDIAQYRYNMVVALNELGDGVINSGVFHQDVAGEGFIYPARSEPHSVPPVKHERYVVIYLYE